MKKYSQAKFSQLSVERQARVLLEIIYHVEKVWQNASERDECIQLINNYLQWFLLNASNPLVTRLQHLQFRIDQDVSLRELMNISVPLERFLDLSIRDENIIDVKQGDMQSSPRLSHPLFFVLDHLRSAFNVGSLFRTADCLGVQHIYLVGYTPTPEDRGVLKTAMGAESSVSWSSHMHLQEVKDILDQKNVPLVAMETVKSAQSLIDFRAPEKMAWLVGNERFGLSQKALNMADLSVAIPMFGKKNSLNVANSLSIASFEVVRQWQSLNISP